MSLKTAAASYLDVFKRNCSLKYLAFSFDVDRGGAPPPDFNLKLYQTYVAYPLVVPYPYSKKPSAQNGFVRGYKGGLTTLEDKLFGSFLGWVFTIPEILFWSVAALSKMIFAVLLFLMSVTLVFGTPFFAFLYGEGLKAYYKDVVWRCLKSVGYVLAFVSLALLRIPYHLIKAIIRIPVGIGIATRAAIEALGVAPVRPSVRLGSDTESEDTDTENNSQSTVNTAGNSPIMPRDEEREYNNAFYRMQTASLNSNAPVRPIKIPSETNLCQEFTEKLDITNIPSRYTCVISGCFMNPPFLLSDGNLYNQRSIKIYLENASSWTSPLTKEPIPLTHLPGIILESVGKEIHAFVVALGANYYLSKIQEKPVSKQEAVFEIAQEIEQKSVRIREEINSYIKELRDLSEGDQRIESLVENILKNPNLKISNKVLAIAWEHIQTLMGNGVPVADITSDTFLKDTLEKAMGRFLEAIREMDASLYDFVIAVLREAILEEQQVSQKFHEIWQFEPVAQDKWFEKLCVPIDLNHLNEAASSLAADPDISNTALQYTLKLIKEPKQAVKFAEFESEEKEKLVVAQEFLQALYAPGNEIFRELFLVMLKEVILAERDLPQEFSDDPLADKVKFASMWKNSVNDANTSAKHDTLCCHSERSEESPSTGGRLLATRRRRGSE